MFLWTVVVPIKQKVLTEPNVCMCALGSCSHTTTVINLKDHLQFVTFQDGINVFLITARFPVLLASHNLSYNLFALASPTDKGV